MDDLEHGLELKRQGKYKEALTSLQAAVQKDPESCAAWTHLGDVQYRLTRYPEALSAIYQALQIDPQHALAWGVRARVLFHLNQYDEALTACDTALKSDPNLAHALTTQGMILEQRGEAKAAFKLFDRARTIEPDFPDALAGICRLLLANKQLDEALRAADCLVQVYPNNVVGWHCKAIVHYVRSEHTQVNKAFEDSKVNEAFNEALRIDPNDIRTWILLASLLADTQQYDKALETINHALDIDLNNAEAQDTKNYILQAKKQYKINTLKEIGGILGRRILRSFDW
jgi:tetratricopeptide (TPR) repeat protein